MQNASAGIVEPGPALGAGDIPVHLPADTFRSVAGCYPFLTDSSFHSYLLELALHRCRRAFLRVCAGSVN